MCGIVGYIGTKKAGDVILEGLRKLEYRGYDSAGMVLLINNEFELRRSLGKIIKLDEKLKKDPVAGHTGIGHTRWATHGKPSEENAHPHIEGDIAVVHNGILENFLSLREELKKEGHKFKSETDTEVFAHLISREQKKGLSLEESVRQALTHVKGSYALAVMSKKETGKIIGARKESPMVVGIGEKEAILSSDVTAILSHTNKVIFMEDNETVVITKDKVDFFNDKGVEIEKLPKTITWSPVQAEKEGYRHFMLKEIMEQPKSVTDTFRSIVLEESGDIIFSDFNIDLTKINRIVIIACGTSYHSAMVGKFLLEEMLRMPVEVDLGSEFRYRDPVVDENSLVISISQSGETADTLAAVREAKRKNTKIITICNVIESSLTREADFTLYTHAGPEIGVASTKAFTTQLTALYLLSLYLGKVKKLISKENLIDHVQELVHLPQKISKALTTEKKIEEIARKYFHYKDFLFLGRGINHAIALEGALKLKEISYIHAEGYAAGELKHGPIALIDEDTPSVFLMPRDAHYVKIMANMEEVKARGGKVIAIVNEGDEEATKVADEVIEVPSTSHMLNPIVLSIPLQLLSYHIAVHLGTDIDQPRNLAKSVTVE